MMPPPLWKIQREITRVGRQIRAIPSAIADLVALANEPAQRRAHFAKLKERVAVVNGTMAETERIAVLLIYQPQGLAESTFVLCKDLVKAGFSPFVVTNSPLSDADTARLQSCCWKIMTRPNFGYDFGGYQDALIALRDIKPDVDYLIVMNDSVWLEFTPDLWERLATVEADVVGLIQEDKILKNSDDAQQIDYRNIQSYFYLFRHGVWSAPWFWQFWTTYKMTSNKKRTIKRGEIGFSKFLFAQNVTLKALVTRNAFIRLIQSCTAEDVRNILLFSAYRGKRLLRAKDDLLAKADGSDIWRSEALKHIELTLMQEPLNGVYWVSVCKVFEINLIKKNKDLPYCRMRRAYFDAHKAGFAKELDTITASELTQSVLAERDIINAAR